MIKKIVLLLVFWGFTLSSAWALPQARRSASWGYEPTYTSLPSYNSNASYYGSSYGTRMEKSAYPAYNFRSTSPYAMAVGNTSGGFTMLTEGTGSYNPWDDEGDPEGEGIGNVNTPVGEPLVLLLMAVVYGLFRAFRLRKRKF